MSKFKRVLSEDWLPEEFSSGNEIPVTSKMVNREALDSIIGQVEQAVLQSHEIQALRKDTERLDWLESCEDSHGFCHAGYGDYIYYAQQLIGMPTVREVIDDAMEKQT